MSFRFKIILSWLTLAAFTLTTPLLAQTVNDKNVQADNVGGLTKLIENKTKELRQLQEERDKLESKLDEISNTSRSLNQEIRSINYKISQLNISMKVNEAMVERLELELKSLQSKIDQAKIRIVELKKILANLMVELQQTDNESMLFLILKNKSLSESVSTVQSILDLNNQLIKTINDLGKLRIDLNDDIAETLAKKKKIEIEQGSLMNRQEIINKQKEEKEYVLKLTKNQEKIYEQKIKELDQKQEAISKVMTTIENQLRAKFNPNILPVKRPGVLAMPLSDTIVTQCYGKTKFARRAYRSKFHSGLDLSAPLGTPIFAADDGRVAAVDNNDAGRARWLKYQYGKYIIIRHNNNLSTLYAHMSKQVVKVGQEVKRGDLIGYSGNTGYVTGPHLHFGIFWAPSVRYKSIPPARGLVPIGVTINPADYLPNSRGIEKCPK